MKKLNLFAAVVAVCVAVPALAQDAAPAAAPAAPAMEPGAQASDLSGLDRVAKNGVFLELAGEGGLYSLSPRWREGAHAVLWKPGEATDERSFTLTSPVVAVAAEEPEPKPTPWVDRPPPSEPPSFRRLSPRSMTRLHLAAVAAPDR